MPDLVETAVNSFDNDTLLQILERLDIVVNGMQFIYNGLMFFVVLFVVGVIIYLLTKFVLGWFTY